MMACPSFVCFFLTAFLVVAIIQCAYLFIFFFRKKYQSVSNKHSEKPVSIIICARNESRNLQLFLRKILQQIYAGSYEVIVVNDASEDDTTHVLEDFKIEFPHLEIVNISTAGVRHLPGKKFALEKGIEKSRYDNLLFTDADCEPSSAYWLQNMADALEEKSIVLGYGAYQKKQGILNKFIRWETVHTCMQYCSLSSIGLTYMGVGRNMMYKKSLLQSLKTDEGFKEMYSSTSSGDDDLIISEIATNDNVNICLSSEAATISISKTTWLEWWMQKTRHVSTGKFYKANVKFVLGMYALSHSLFWLLSLAGIGFIFAGIVKSNAALLFIALFSTRLILYWINAANWYRNLGEKKLAYFYPLGDIGWFLYNIFLSPYIFWKNKIQWK